MKLQSDRLWDDLRGRMRQLETLDAVMEFMEWDQETYMGSGSIGLRGAHQAVLSMLHHEKLTDPQVGLWVEALKDSSDPLIQGAIAKLHREHEREVRVPSSVVEGLASARSEGWGAWMKAREADDFSIFQPRLQRILDLTREMVAHYGPADDIYDHLLEAYNPGLRVAQVKPLFEDLGTGLRSFLDELDGGSSPAKVEGSYDVDTQKKLHHDVMKAMGFRMNEGRLDHAEHPFCISMGPADVRLTTHIYEDDFFGSLYNTMHECGHGLYEQGLPSDWLGTGMATAPGMGIHESQSLFWENFIGRSLPFYQWLQPQMVKAFPGFKHSPEELYRSVNRVERSLIRIYSDEVTYNLHVLLRFDLEYALLNGTLSVADLPEAWDAAYRSGVGVVAPSAAQGVLQDVHWSKGLFGYFPNYALGSIYAANLGLAMERENPQLWQNVQSGNFEPILSWLREKVHQKGHMHLAPEIVQQAVGDVNLVDGLLGYFRGRHGKIYGL